MEKFTLKTLIFSLFGLVLISCDKTEETEVNPFSASSTQNFGTDPTSQEIIEFDGETQVESSRNGAVTTVYNQGAPIRITAQQRLSKGRYLPHNAAMLFDTGAPDSRNAAFRTPNPAAIRPMGNVLTLGRSNGKWTNLYNRGGRIELDFSALGSVELKGIHVLDVTEEEAASKVELLDANGDIIKTMPLPVTGAHGATRLRIDTPGVVKLRVVFGDENNRSGGGAIDVIEFNRE